MFSISPKAPRTPKFPRFLLLCAVAALPLSLVAQENQPQSVFGPTTSDKHPHPPPPPIHPNPNADTLHRWNQIAIDASGFDHANAREQFGPCRASRAMAIVHIAMADSVSATHGNGNDIGSYTGVKKGKDPISTDVSIAQAGHDTLVALFPSQAATFDGFLNEDLLKEKDKKAKAGGQDLGARAAAAILALRAADGSQKIWSTIPPTNEEQYSDYAATTPGINNPGSWTQDPVGLQPIALGAHWGECMPFVMTSASQFRIPPPPALTSPSYTIAYDEVKAVGSMNSTVRTPEQSFIGIFWAYDGTPSLCAPPRFYNQILVHIADQKHLDVVHMAQLLALANVAMADAGFASWESKFFYKYWRPVIGIRESDGNPNTVPDPSFTPLGAPASNLSGPNFTPPFPSYPSGHATFGGALFQTLRRYFKTDKIPFTIVSDEFDGKTTDNQGNVRPYMPRYFSTLSQAEEENGQSRIYLGIHWKFDKEQGIAQGEKIGNYVFDHAYQKK